MSTLLTWNVSSRLWLATRPAFILQSSGECVSNWCFLLLILHLLLANFKIANAFQPTLTQHAGTKLGWRVRESVFSRNSSMELSCKPPGRKSLSNILKKNTQSEEYPPSLTVKQPQRTNSRIILGYRRNTTPRLGSGCWARGVPAVFSKGVLFRS